MFNNIDVQEAVKRALQTEKNAMNFYEMGAQQMVNPDAKRVFELLAKEERGHAQQFFDIYQGSDIPSFELFMESPADYESSWVAALTKAIIADFTVQNALELALEKELSPGRSAHGHLYFRIAFAPFLQQLLSEFGSGLAVVTNFNMCSVNRYPPHFIFSLCQ